MEKTIDKEKTACTKDRLRRSTHEWDEHTSHFVPSKKRRSIVRALEYGRYCEASCGYHLSKVEAQLAKVKDKNVPKITKATQLAAPNREDNVKSGMAIAGSDECHESWVASDSDSEDEAISKHLGIAIDRIQSAIKSIDPALDATKGNPFDCDVSDEEIDPLAYTSDNEEDMEGYESDNDDFRLQWFCENNEEVLCGRSVVFSGDIIQLPMGKLFHNGLVFRHIIKALAQRDCFRLCPMINNRQCISCECSDIFCDWHIEGKKFDRGPMFRLTNFNPVHTCLQKKLPHTHTSVWVAYQFLDKWKGDLKVIEKAIKDELMTLYGVACPMTKLMKAQRVGREIIGADHAEAYTKLTQFTSAVEGLDQSHKVILEIDSNVYTREPRFKGLFLSFSDTHWAFKLWCRPFIAVDGWPLGGEYGGVMLTALGLDGNDGILPIAMYEVESETSFTWYDFLEKLNGVLRVDNGQGFCVLSDGENGVAEGIEMQFCLAENRVCAAKVYERMRALFPSPNLGHLFWEACRTTSAKDFKRHMNELKGKNDKCHAWLKASGWEKWAMHCMPNWTKTTHVTNTISQQFQSWMENYFAQNITRRFEGLARKIQQLMDRRRSVDWLWKDKLTPVVRKKLMMAIKSGKDVNTEIGEVGSFNVIANRKEQFHVDIDQQTCSCGGWQLSGIPCAHATKCILCMNGRLEDFVDPLFSTDRYNRTYAKKMDAVRTEEYWPKSTFGPILPPNNEGKKHMFTGRRKSKINGTKIPEREPVDGCLVMV